MKIINEIEKSRLNEENMHQINDGDNSCNPYLSCQPKYTVTPCALYNHCPEVIMKKNIDFSSFHQLFSNWYMPNQCKSGRTI